ncbi:MAG: hypothetical protein WKF74_16880 [Pyrinomonadaceae bacterium]
MQSMTHHESITSCGMRSTPTAGYVFTGRTVATIIEASNRRRGSWTASLTDYDSARIVRTKAV